VQHAIVSNYMSRKWKDKKRKGRRPFFENTILVLVGVMAFFLAGAAHDRGIALKWVTALFATVMPFSLVIYARRRTLSRSFWMSVLICLAIHTLVIWVIFQYVLAAFSHFSPLLWLPFMLAELVGLIILSSRIERAFTGKRDVVELDF
jgi:predicted neutral ceramidase superfamily lipid hydrolase